MPEDAQQGGQTRCSVADGSARLSHTPQLGGLEVTEHLGWSLGTTATGLLFLLAKVTLHSPSKKRKVSHGHLFIKVALCFFCFHKNSTGSAHPTRRSPNCQEQHQQTPAPSPGLMWVPNTGSFCHFSVMLICLGFYLLLQYLTSCTDQDYSKRMTDRG